MLNLLTDRLRDQAVSGLPADMSFMQVSNPCWYRYLILKLDEKSGTVAQARVRVYEHFWAGDNGGSLPKSWEQEVGMVETSTGWRVDLLGPSDNAHSEPGEPHGPTLSACRAPTPAAPVP